MMDDARARELLEAAGHDVPADSLDADRIATLSRRAHRRRLGIVVGAAAAVSLVIGSGLLLRPGFGGDGPAAGTATPAAGPGLPTINTSQYESRDIMEALVGGTLQVSSGGCLVAKYGDGVIDVLWPKGFSVARVDGSAVVLDASGHQVAAIGSSFTAAGGFLPVRSGLACRATSPSADVMFAQAEFKSILNSVEPIINTRRSDEAHFLPSFAGVLQMSAQGCVYAQTATRRIDIVWPSGYSVVREPDGTVDVKDVQGRAVATVGSIFSFGEGGSTAEPAELACRAGGPNTTARDIYPPFDRHGR